MPISSSLIRVARVSFRGVLLADGSDQKNIANVFHYRRLSVSADPFKGPLATAFNTAVLQVYLNACNVDVAQAKICVRWIDDAEDSESEFIPGANTAGQVAGERLPSKSAVRMLFRTSLRGRHWRGAKSFCGVTEADTTGEILTGAPLALWILLRNACAAQLTDATTNVWAPCVYSKILSIEETNPTTIRTADLSEVLLNKTIGSMNRRRVQTVR